MLLYLIAVRAKLLDSGRVRLLNLDLSADEIRRTWIRLMTLPLATGIAVLLTRTPAISATILLPVLALALACGYTNLKNSKNSPTATLPPAHKNSLPAGFYRFATQLSYTLFMTAIPIWAAEIHPHSISQTLWTICLALTLISLGFIQAIDWGRSAIRRLPVCLCVFPAFAASIGYLAVSLVQLHVCAEYLLICSFALGVGQYCFRVSRILVDYLLLRAAQTQEPKTAAIRDEWLQALTPALSGCVFCFGISQAVGLSLVSLIGPLLIKSVIQPHARHLGELDIQKLKDVA